MAYNAKILADSINNHEERLTTVEVTFPRYILPEWNTHRTFSRNSASSRAVPTEKKLQQILDDPVIPLEWGVNQPGMQSTELLSEQDAQLAEQNWLQSRDFAILGAVALLGGLKNLKESSVTRDIEQIQAKYGSNRLHVPSKGIHKQFVNRLLEPFLWHTVVNTATEWDNFFALRLHPAAQPEIKHTAELLKKVMDRSTPTELNEGEWHLPFIKEQEKGQYGYVMLTKMAVARCARVSYETHDRGVIDLEKDVQLHDTLRDSGHMSPFEHVARPLSEQERAASEWSGNFKGWHQYRKDIPNEENYGNVVNE